MTVKELIEKLQECEPDAEVMLMHNASQATRLIKAEQEFWTAYTESDGSEQRIDHAKVVLS